MGIYRKLLFTQKLHVMPNKRTIKRNLYLDFHGHLNGPDDFTPKERRFFKWFMIACVAGVITAYWIF
jgi:hypothetical protein